MADRTDTVRARLLEGMAIPAHPLALTEDGHLDFRRQRALGRYYLDAGAGGLAVAVHTTQFAIRNAAADMHRTVLAVAADVARHSGRDPVLVAGVCGPTDQALREAEMAAALGYDIALVSLGGVQCADERDLVRHCAAVGEVLPVFGFYLQPAVGGRVLSRGFWSALAEMDALVAVKVAPFNRYQTLDVMLAVADSGRADEIALYTGNDDSIVSDLLLSLSCGGREMRFAGGLLGQWAVGTRRAVQLLDEVRLVREGHVEADHVLGLAGAITDTNAALFDAANGYRGCIAGIHEVLVRQGLMAGRRCLDPLEDLSPGQLDEIDRVLREYPQLHDDAFIEEHLDGWLAD
jgi:dihydrodipicolinate synthase/N-acetylneuraminate lyase